MGSRLYYTRLSPLIHATVLPPFPSFSLTHFLLFFHLIVSHIHPFSFFYLPYKRFMAETPLFFFAPSCALSLISPLFFLALANPQLFIFIFIFSGLKS
uniref:Uncharacterized protein n=1 Tax=Meloidogyne enterolobii TaxID=390850 RepID=A0A6V7VAA4_MELEN|nr:unnamed protein product [Meloidogyne enterolobii]